MSLALFVTQDLYIRLKEEICAFLLKKLELRIKLLQEDGKIQTESTAKRQFIKFSTEIKESLAHDKPLTAP